jgi:hypothetical protein
VHSRDVSTFTSLETIHAGHGTDCSAPPATHDISSYQDAVFLCRDHVMTAIKAGGYGVIYLTPDHLVDFSGGTAVIKFDVSTLRTSDRDWIDLWVTPFDENVQLVGDIGAVDLNGFPRNALHVRMDQFNGATIFRGYVTRNFNDTLVGSNDTLLLEQIVTPSAATRTTFELDVSRTHMRFGVPGSSAWWVDTSFADLGWSSGTVQIGHHSYNPEKSDGCGPPLLVAVCSANTWHWDNVSISPAIPFSMLHPDRATATAVSNQLAFDRPAPSGAHLRFTGIGTNLDVSFDGGGSWQTPQLQSYSQQLGDDHFRSYWTPVPEGAQTVRVRGSNWFGGPWLVRNVTIWSPDAASAAPSPLPVQSSATPMPAPLPLVSSAPPAAPRSGPVSLQPPPSGGSAAVNPGLHSSWMDQSAYPILTPGDTATITMHFRNAGSESWQVGVDGRQVNLAVVGDSTAFADLGMSVGWLSANRLTTTVERVVAPGQIGTFKFAVRAPSTPGSYRLDLGLVADGVAWLDDQGVFAVVQSDYGFHSAWVAESPWPTVRGGEVTGPITIAFRNTGTQTWDREDPGHRVLLGVAGDDTSWSVFGQSWPAPNRVAWQGETSVAPGSLGTFTFQIRAPSAPGTYLLPLRPLVEGATWLDDEGVYLQLTVSP